jgi:succinate dehydrogenase/fumarate reductase flavoprotein subunit
MGFPTSLIVAGGGMAGLVAAARARELGLRPTVYEKGTRAGGSMLLSSGVIWRHRTLESFRAECPDGNERLQRAIVERLDDALAWLEGLGAPVMRRETGNERTVGMRFDTRGLTDALVRAAGDVRLGEAAPLDASPLVLATGGFQGDPALVTDHIAPAAPLLVRANPWSAGDGLRAGLARGAAVSAGLDEFYGRNMPDVPVPEGEFVRASQLYARCATVVDERGEPFVHGPVTWSENDVVAATARRPNAAAWYLLRPEALDERVGDRTVAEMVESARTVGGTVVPPERLPFAAPEGVTLGVHVRAAITHTIGGLRVDDRARVLDAGGQPLDGVYAAGVDGGGIATGGYASGLAAALVLGLAAAEDLVQRASA